MHFKAKAYENLVEEIAQSKTSSRELLLQNAFGPMLEKHPVQLVGVFPGSACVSPGVLWTLVHRRKMAVRMQAVNLACLLQVIRTAYALQQDSPINIKPVHHPLQHVPKGDAYPLFLGYSEALMRLASLERRHLNAQEEAIERRRKVLAELEDRSKALAEQGCITALEGQRALQLHADRYCNTSRLSIEVVNDSTPVHHVHVLLHIRFSICRPH